jgi:hypothetical protein
MGYRISLKLQEIAKTGPWMWKFHLLLIEMRGFDVSKDFGRVFYCIKLKEIPFMPPEKNLLQTGGF